MNLKDLENKTILLFGKPRAFNAEEFASQMKSHSIELVKEFDANVTLLVEGRMMTPYEQNAADAFYEEGVLSSISIDILEDALAKEIDSDVLLMSLKLSHDKERLKTFLQNSMLSNELYFKLLSMYSWSGEDFFENDDNRDVSAALILRFYENIERNHSVQYATTGILHLIAQTSSSELLLAISNLEPLKYHPKIEAAIATHLKTPREVLISFIKSKTPYVKTLIAMRIDCDEELQDLLFNSGEEEVLEALSYNENLKQEILIEFMKDEKLAKNIARYIRLTKEMCALLYTYPQELAKNTTLTLEMQNRLLEFHDDTINLSLAYNEHIEEEIATKLIYSGSKDISFAIYENISTPVCMLKDAYENEENHLALAYNENTPQNILTLLFKSEDPKVLMGLSKNENTPIELLYQLQLDSRFASAVKENAGFGRHIQTENIGWLI